MEPRHTLTSSSFWALPAGWRLSQVLPWICLVMVASTAAYGLQLAGAAMIPSAAADQLDRSYQTLGGHDISDQRGSLVQASSTTSMRMVLITGEDAATGDSTQVECVTAS